MAFVSIIAGRFVKKLPTAPVFWNGCLIWITGSRWGAFRVQYETHMVQAMVDEVCQSDVFVDVGANCGFWSIWACKINPALRVVAIEPSRVCDELRLLIKINHLDSHIQVIEKCVSTHSGFVRFYDNRETTSGLSLEWTKRFNANIQERRVACLTLDEALDEARKIVSPTAKVFVKCDIEGHEEQIFEHLTNLRDQRIRFCVEVHNCDNIETSTVWQSALRAGRHVMTLGRCYGVNETVLF